MFNNISPIPNYFYSKSSYSLIKLRLIFFNFEKIEENKDEAKYNSLNSVICLSLFEFRPSLCSRKIPIIN